MQRIREVTLKYIKRQDKTQEGDRLQLERVVELEGCCRQGGPGGEQPLFIGYTFEVRSLDSVRNRQIRSSWSVDRPSCHLSRQSIYGASRRDGVIIPPCDREALH